MQGLKLKIDRVMPGEDAAFAQWDALLREIFKDPDDLETTEDLFEALGEVDKNMFYLFREVGQAPSGFELVQMDPRMPGIKVGYVPWTGVVEGLRNHGVYPALSRSVMDICKDAGIAVLLHEVEDPKRIHRRKLGEGETVEEVVSLATRRFNFWRRPPMNSIVIDDGMSADNNSLTAYVRPASSDDQVIQDYDLMVLRVLDAENPMLTSVFNTDKTAITMSAYKRFYLQMNQIQYDIEVPLNKTGEDYYTYLEARMRKELPAVEDFCKRVDMAMAQGLEWMPVVNEPVQPKSRPDPVHDISLGANIKPLQSKSAKVVNGKQERHAFKAPMI